MAINVTINNTQKPLVEIVTESRNGQTFEFLSIDGIKLDGRVDERNKRPCGALCVLNYRSEAEKLANIEFIQKIVDNSNKRGMALVFEVAQAYQMAAMQHELGIPTDDKPETVDIKGYNCKIIYSKKTMYNETLTEEITNCKDLPDMPKEAIKAVLIERAKNVLR